MPSTLAGPTVRNLADLQHCVGHFYIANSYRQMPHDIRAKKPWLSS